MKVLDLFSGIGGFSLGLEWAGFKTVAFCEYDEKAQQVLRKHWPNVFIFSDVKELTYEKLKSEGITKIDVITGGFPCQDISYAGKGAGITAPRSGLWKEYTRLISEIRPKYAIVENVSALLNRGLSTVLGDLASLGYDAEWHCIPASAIGAPHRRDRIWIVAYPNKERKQQQKRIIQEFRERSVNDSEENISDSNLQRIERRKWNRKDSRENERIWNNNRRRTSINDRLEWWRVESDVGRVANGIPERVDRLKQLGNSVVPQIPYLIGLAIKEIENIE